MGKLSIKEGRLSVLSELSHSQQRPDDIFQQCGLCETRFLLVDRASRQTSPSESTLPKSALTAAALHELIDTSQWGLEASK